MLTIPEAFEKFRSRLEISDGEAADASSRQQTIRDQVQKGISVDRTFLTGSYDRHTKTKPLKDVDIFAVLAESEADFLSAAPDQVLDQMIDCLSPHYPGHVEKGNRSVKVAFPGDTTDKIVSFDVVPAFERDSHFRIPDRRQGTWIATDPRIHAELATSANKAMSKQWKPIVKMIKKWNDHQDKPIKPSFLIEVMALQLLAPPWGNSYPREIRGFFASALDRLDEEWHEPAGLGPAVTARFDENPHEREQARTALRAAEHTATEALRLERDGKIGAALEVWQELFGLLFVKS